MEQEITNWQNLWKTTLATPVDLNGLINHLNIIARKGKIERAALMTIVPITLIVLSTVLAIFSNVYYLISIILIGLGMLMILIQSYRSKHNKVDETMLSQPKNVANLIDKLQERKLTTSRYMWLYAFLLIAGLNIGYIAILEQFQLPLLGKIAVHVMLTAILFYIMYYNIKKRVQQNEQEITPLIKLLEDM